MAAAVAKEPQMAFDEVAFEELIRDQELGLKLLDEYAEAQRQWDGIKGSRDIVSQAQTNKKQAKDKFREILPAVRAKTVIRRGEYTITITPPEEPTSKITRTNKTRVKIDIGTGGSD